MRKRISRLTNAVRPPCSAAWAKLMLLPGDGAKIDAATIDARMGMIRNDVHQVQPAAISITNASEYGLAWTPGEVASVG